MKGNKALFWYGFLGCVIAILISCKTADEKSSVSSKAGFQFAVSFPSEVHSEAITGRAYVIFSRNNEREPRFQVSYTGVPFFGKNISALKPDKQVVLDHETFGYPIQSLSDIPAGEYYVQGFINIYTEFKRADGHSVWLHNDQWEGQQWNRSPGNLYSDVKKVKFDPSKKDTRTLICSNIIPPVEIPQDTQWVKRIKFRSKLLTEFWGQPVYLGATILLPKGYDERPDLYYPVNYIQGHFSLRAPNGFTTEKPQIENRWSMRGYEFYKFWISEECPRMICVTFQHPCPYYDDSYAVNSANCGPYGDAIIQELIPFVEEHFRIIREPYARVLSGGSTGGWEALALQIFHPDFFGGTWSLCPDSVDFRYHQVVNIYEEPNAYYKEYDWMKVERPSCRMTDGNIRFTMKDENYYELAIGDKSRSGGQWDIWEAAYGPVGEDGYPERLWDKVTGEIDHSVAEHWRENYDLRHYLEKNWSWIGPKLEGKLHIYTGSMDSFYLNGAVVLLEEYLEKTQNPYYAGVVKYGEREPHCWGPRGAELLELMADHIVKNAPSGENTDLWLYK
ncbi:MAG: alpha/beta hydrolase-fold protein [Candidatus Aminicenantes bacterium]|jgi:hypothetical protein